MPSTPMFTNPLYNLLVDNKQLPVICDITHLTTQRENEPDTQYFLIGLDQHLGLDLENGDNQLIFKSHHISIYQQQADDSLFPHLGPYHYTADYQSEQVSLKLHVYFDQQYQICQTTLKQVQGDTLISIPMTATLEASCNELAYRVVSDVIGQIRKSLDMSRDKAELKMTEALDALVVLSRDLPTNKQAYIKQGQTCLELINNYQSLILPDSFLNAIARQIKQANHYLRKDVAASRNSDSDEADTTSSESSTDSLAEAMADSVKTPTQVVRKLKQDEVNSLLNVLDEATVQFQKTSDQPLKNRLQSLSAYEQQLLGYDILKIKVSSLDSVAMTKVAHHRDQIKRYQLVLFQQVLQVGQFSLLEAQLKNIDDDIFTKLLVSVIQRGQVKILIKMLALGKFRQLHHIFINGKSAIQYCHDQGVSKQNNMAERQAYRSCLAALVIYGINLFESQVKGMPLACYIYFSPAYHSFYEIQEIHACTFAQPHFRASMQAYLASPQSQKHFDELSSFVKADDIVRLQTKCRQPVKKAQRKGKGNRKKQEQKPGNKTYSCLQHTFFKQEDNCLTYSPSLRTLYNQYKAIAKLQKVLLDDYIAACTSKLAGQALFGMFNDFGIEVRYEPTDLLPYAWLEANLAERFLRDRISFHQGLIAFFTDFCKFLKESTEAGKMAGLAKLLDEERYHTASSEGTMSRISQLATDNNDDGAMLLDVYLLIQKPKLDALRDLQVKLKKQDKCILQLAVKHDSQSAVKP